MKNFTIALAILSLGLLSEHSSAQARALVALYDSIYTWNQDGNNWDVNTKTVAIVYDGNNNLLSEVLQKWTGTAWVDSAKTTNTYNSANSSTSYLYQTWSGSAWVNNAQTLYTYNAANFKTGELSQTWNDTGWLSNYQYIITYDGNNRETVGTTLSTNGTNLVNSSQDLYTYNSNNLVLTEILQVGDSTGAAWVNSTKDSFTYDSNNLKASDLAQWWSNGAWVNNTLILYTYNSANKLTMIMNEGWVNNVPDTASRTVNTFNTDNELTNSLLQNHTDTGWLNESQSTGLTYDSFKNMTNSITQFWVNGAWMNEFQHAWAYNALDLDSFYLYQYWNNSTWVTGSQSTYGYDNNGIKVWEVDYQDVGGTDSMYWYFTRTVEGVAELPVNTEQLTVYPNPATNFIYADIDLKQTEDLQLQLVNMLGQTVWRADAGNVSNYQNNIAVTNLPGGVYLLVMITGNGTQSREVVVTH